MSALDYTPQRPFDDEQFDLAAELLHSVCPSRPGLETDTDWREHVVSRSIQSLARVARATEPGHEPVLFPPGRLQAFLEVVTPREVRRLIATIRHEKRLRREVEARLAKAEARIAELRERGLI